MSKPCDHPDYWAKLPDGVIGPPGIDRESMANVQVLNTNATSLYVDQTPRPILSVDEAVRRYREASKESSRTYADLRATSEARQQAADRANAAAAALMTARYDFERAVQQESET